MRLFLLSIGLLAVAAVAPARAEAQLTRSEVADVLLQHSDAIRACYETRLAGGPALSGRFVLVVTIRADGRVQNARVVRSTLEKPGIERCIERVIYRTRFAESGAPVTLRYPFVFR